MYSKRCISWLIYESVISVSQSIIRIREPERVEKRKFGTVVTRVLEGKNSNG